MLAMAPPGFSSPEDAFRLSNCLDTWIFTQKLHRLLSEGMPSTARRARHDSERENVPRTTWIGCRPTLLGEVLSKEFLRYHESPTGHTTLEHREFRGYAKPTLMIGQTWSDHPDIVWLDLYFLTVDFEAACAKTSEPQAPKTSEPQADAPPSDDDVRTLIRAEAAKRRGFISQKNGAKIVREKFPGYNDEHARELVKAVTGNKNTGPKGPRK
jgi:hypothetical protein